MNIDVRSLTRTMVDAASREAREYWPKLRALAEPELRKIAETIEDVNQLLADGEINQDRARELVRIQQQSAASVLRTVEGLNLLTARRVSDAAARAARAVVIRLIGFDLL